MADNRKEQERAELHRAIWDIACNIVHAGTVDQSEFKQYVLGVMFYRYISDNLMEYINQGEIEAGNKDFDYAELPDEAAEGAREGLVAEKGFFILPSELFCNVRKNAAANENLNETLDKVFKNIENSAQGTESENDFKGLFADVDVNSNKLGGTVAERNKTLRQLLDGVGEMKLNNYQDTTIDVFGDAYEYLISMYASSAGKKGGEFYTPQEVSELLTRITLVGKTEVNKVYDPAVGSGSLLLNFAKILGKENVRQGFYGQEINITTYNLCRINMFLHDIGYNKFDIAHGDTLTNPQHWDDEPFEAIVSNPPYSIPWEGDANPVLINDPRFAPAGVLAPRNNADFAFILHSLSWLSTNGTAAIVCFPGIMSRGHAEKKIRQYLIDNNYIDCIIQLPKNLFFGTSTATCVMVLKKSKNENTTLFIDASNEFIKIGVKNKLTNNNITNILNTYKSKENKEFFSRVVANSEIELNDYNLNVSIYVKQADTREKIDIKQSYIVTEQLETQHEFFMRATNSEQLANDEISINSLINDLCPKGIEFKPFGEIATIVRGASPRPIKKFITNDENGVNWIKIGDVSPKSKYITSTKEKITKEGAKKSRLVKSGDFILSNSMSFGRPYIMKIDGYIHDGWLSISDFEDSYIPDFLYYLLSSNVIQNKMAQRASVGTVQNLNADIVKSLNLPILPIEVQIEIVKTLDNFTEITDILKKEIEIKQKQYEYYKDRFLSFKAVSE